ncbi:MAG: hypothetical protein LW819_09675 [Fimbriimonadaceae bacterium]|jgi:hypothetical protein|nr:hypothetical protein [Fimbriimonadaceae bacterium]
MTDWIERDGGPQPVADDVWVEVDEGHIDYLVGPARDFEWDRVEWFRWNIINQHLIDAARLEGIRLGLEAAADEAEAGRRPSMDWCDHIATAIRALDPETIAKEADQ